MGISLLFLILSTVVFAETESPAEKSLSDFCVESLKALPGKSRIEELKQACSQAAMLPSCVSEKGVRIFHYDKAAKGGEKEPKKILVFALMHGDEFPSGSVARSWMERLSTIEPRNSWRVVPIVNPDGLKNKTRYNANGVDVNRNFPSKDWDEKALSYWEKRTKKDKRRFPGNKAASEKETICSIAHIDEFDPDLILSIHTPYNVLDFDGPKIKAPAFAGMPWKTLGTYPGSLGRYMWADRLKPTLTIELSGTGVAEKLERFDKLQDITGDIAIKSEKILKDQDEEKPKSASGSPPKKP